MKIYNVLWQDRHSDTTATPFLNFDVAKKWAYGKAKNFCRDERDFKEGSVNGHLYYVEYSCEGDCLWITEHKIESEL